jgi:hypothetical protein
LVLAHFHFSLHLLKEKIFPILFYLSIIAVVSCCGIKYNAR